MLRDKTKNRAKTSLFFDFQTALERACVVLDIQKYILQMIESISKETFLFFSMVFYFYRVV